MNIIEQTDEEILETAHKWWSDLIKFSNKGQYGKFIRNFSYDLLLGLNEVELGKQFSKSELTRSLSTDYDFLGFIGEEQEPGLYVLIVKNQIRRGDILEYVGFDILYIEDNSFTLLDEDKRAVEKADHGKAYFIQTNAGIKEGYLIRRKRIKRNCQ